MIENNKQKFQLETGNRTNLITWERGQNHYSDSDKWHCRLQNAAFDGIN